MRLSGNPGPRDGEVAVLQQRATQEGAVAARSMAPAHRMIPRPESVIEAALAQKVLHGWMQNRHQTLYPLVLNLRNMTVDVRRLITGAMALALQAGECDEATERRAAAWLRSIGGGDEDAAALAEAQRTSPSIAAFVAMVRSAGQGPQAYAATVATLSRRSTVNRRFHDYFAARLGIADEVARSMNRRYGS